MTDTFDPSMLTSHHGQHVMRLLGDHGLDPEPVLRAAGLTRSRRREKGRVDAAAAQLILQAWLDNPGIAR